MADIAVGLVIPNVIALFCFRVKNLLANSIYSRTRTQRDTNSENNANYARKYVEE